MQLTCVVGLNRSPGVTESPARVIVSTSFRRGLSVTHLYYFSDFHPMDKQMPDYRFYQKGKKIVVLQSSD